MAEVWQDHSPGCSIFDRSRGSGGAGVCGRVWGLPRRGGGSRLSPSTLLSLQHWEQRPCLQPLLWKPTTLDSTRFSKILSHLQPLLWKPTTLDSTRFSKIRSHIQSLLINQPHLIAKTSPCCDNQPHLIAKTSPCCDNQPHLIAKTSPCCQN